MLAIIAGFVCGQGITLLLKGKSSEGSIVLTVGAILTIYVFNK